MAKEDIDVGLRVVLEKAFVSLVFDRFSWKCNICLKEYGNFKPCDKCSVALFCENCQSHSEELHSYECGQKFSDESELNGSIMRVFRSCLLAIRLFSSTDELMNFVEKSLDSDRCQIPVSRVSLSNPESQYEAFLKLPIGVNSVNCIIDTETSCIIFQVYTMLLQFADMSSFFSDTKSLRFLIHLIGHHNNVIDYNSTFAKSIVLTENPEKAILSGQTGLIAQYFKHSCAPNVLLSTFDGFTVVTTIRTLKKGDALVHSHLMLMTETKESRQKKLWEQKGFKCSCSLCVKDVQATIEQREMMLSDQDYQNIIMNITVILKERNKTAIHKISEACKKFLRKFGQMSWCEEIGKIVQGYVDIINFQHRGTMKAISIKKSA